MNLVYMYYMSTSSPRITMISAENNITIFWKLYFNKLPSFKTDIAFDTN